MLGLLCAGALLRLAMLPAPRASTIVTALGLVPQRFLSDPFAPEQLVTLVTCCFLHAGWVHLGGNLLFLAVFGPVVEDALGWRRFLVVYLAAGAAGALAHLWVTPESPVPLVGASGAIAGVLGAHLVLEPRGRITTVIPVIVFFEVASIPAAFVIGLWFLTQLASGLAPVGDTAQHVAWFAHLGGFMAGAALTLPVVTARALKKRRQGRVSGRGRARRGKAA